MPRKTCGTCATWSPVYAGDARGKGFAYYDARGSKVVSSSQLDRIRRLAIPPAWTDVWICNSGRGHLQATGRDARGRKQYKYHSEWREFRDRAKFNHLLDFGLALPSIRRRVDADLALPEMSRDRVIALVVRLLEVSLVRVGNEEYVRDNGSYGLTTLRNHHARINGNAVVLTFAGKSGQRHRSSISHPRLVRAVQRCQELPGQLLFQYVEGDEIRPIRSEDVNAYLRTASGLDVTAKDYRTWVGTLLATASLAQVPVPSSQRDVTAVVNRAVELVSRELGNTPAVCRASYIHPAVLEEFREDRLAERWARASTRSPRLLISEERRLLGVLKQLDRSRRRRSNIAA